MVLEARAAAAANWHKAQIRQEEVLGTKTSWRTLFLRLGSLSLPPILSFPKMVRRGDLSLSDCNIVIVDYLLAASTSDRVRLNKR